MIPQPPDSLLVAGHLEFGDALILNGMIRELAKKEPRIVWLTSTNYIRAVREMVLDLPNVEVMGALSYEEVRRRWMPVWPRKLCLGYFNSTGFDEAKWDSEMYRQAGMDYDLRWKNFMMPRKLWDKPTYTRKPVALFHEDPKRAFFVRRNMLPANMEHARIDQRPSILDWLPDIYAARELHFIDSSFLNLAESLYAMGFLRDKALVFHKYAKVYPGKAKWPQLRAPWMIFE
jgi:hypothetical protein